MQKTIALIATRALTHQGALVQAGTRFETSPVDAAALTYQKKARFADGADRVAPATPAAPPVVEPTSRRSRRGASTPSSKPKTTPSRRPRRATTA